ncbi:EI24 domain-containing protein [Microbacterium sp. GXF0217]
MLREFGIGVGMLITGFRFWTVRPKLMALGLIPAVIAFFVLAAVLVPFGFSLGLVTDWATPFADGWISPWREILRVSLGIVMFIAALTLAGAVFTALTLTIGDPFYQRIWRGVERSMGGEPSGETGFWTTVGEGIRLIALGILVALLTLAIGFIPLVGGFLAGATSIVLTGRLLARELTGRAFDARGLTSYSRSEVLRVSRARVLGFGVATQLCFMIPLGAIITMPAAVAGSTSLARSLVERARKPVPPAPPVAGSTPHQPPRPVAGSTPHPPALPAPPSPNA